MLELDTGACWSDPRRTYADAMTDIHPFWLAGRPATGETTLDVFSPHTGAVVGAVSVPAPAQVEAAVAALHDSAEAAQRLTLAERAEALAHVSRRITERGEEIATLITAENGKPITWARIEATRAASVFRWAWTPRPPAPGGWRWCGACPRVRCSGSRRSTSP
jgi:acyl-CoA reductase-like NAD-dependent aldehyde dehydrogenase